MFAQKFIEQLREGNTTEAISTLKEALKEGSNSRIEETRVSVLESYGFSLKEKFEKKDDKEEDEEKETSDDDDEEDKDDDKEDEEKDKDDE